MTQPRISTGIERLDEILHGGLIPGRSYLVRGAPGTGKTILGIHFLTEGVRRGETGLFVNLEESSADVVQNAAELGFDLEDVHFLDLSPGADVFADDRSYDVLAPSDVEKEPFIDDVTRTVADLEPDRVFVDPVTQFRYLTANKHQFRKQVIGFRRYLTEAGATVLFTSQATAQSPDEDLQFMSDGTIELRNSEHGHHIGVPKFRGSAVQSGQHSMRITDGGIVVYPELTPGEHAQEFVSEAVPSGVPELDEQLEGGIERGTVTVLSGPSGSGKTTLGTQFMKEAAGRGERSVLYLFEESEATFLERSESIGVPITEMKAEGSLHVRGMEPLTLSPQQFAQDVRREVEERGTELVMIDGIDGYRIAVQGPQSELVRKLHSVCRYLKNMGVTVLLVDESTHVTGEFRATDAGVSYLADNIVFLRHIEYQGELRKVLGVLKKRTSDFERTLRELEITEHGVQVNDPLTELSGILSGTPTWDRTENPE